VMLGKTGGFVVPLLVAGGFSLLGALSYLLIVGEVAPLPMAASARASLTPAERC